jgi:hypothetical protein
VAADDIGALVVRRNDHDGRTSSVARLVRRRIRMFAAFAIWSAVLIAFNPIVALIDGTGSRRSGPAWAVNLALGVAAVATASWGATLAYLERWLFLGPTVVAATTGPVLGEIATMRAGVAYRGPAVDNDYLALLTTVTMEPLATFAVLAAGILVGGTAGWVRRSLRRENAIP